MQPLSLDRRVTNLEQKVEKLEGLPDRVTALEVQISEFRTEVRGEFSAMNAKLDQKIDETRAEMRVLHEDVIERISRLDEGRKASGRRKRSR